MAIETCFASFGFPRITLNQSCIYGLKLRRFPGYVLVQNEKRGERGWVYKSFGNVFRT